MKNNASISRILRLAAGALLLAAAPARAAPDFEPSQFRAAVQNPTPILVLGTPHLSAQTGFDSEWLHPLLERLAEFRPAGIAVESLPGETLNALEQYAEIYPGVSRTFGRNSLGLSASARAAVGVSMPAAEAAVRKMLATWPSQPGPRDRRRLCALMLAAGDPMSALVQWVRLPDADRTVGDGLTDELVERLNSLMASRNETVSVAARLAARLGLERLHPMDDHTDADLPLSALEAVTKAEQSASFAAARARFPRPTFEAMNSPESVLAAYRKYNSAAAGKADAESQWLARLVSEDDHEIHRLRVAAWETRNLRMAANIREMSARYPGQPILVLVGFAHKPYLEAYLNMMSDMRVVPAVDVLGVADE